MVLAILTARSPMDSPAQDRLSRIADGIDAFSEWCGRAVSWLVLIMVVIIAYDVAMRYLFQSGSVALQELEWHLFALVFLLGAAYTLKQDEHVRVDILLRSHLLNRRHRAWMELIGIVFFLIPFSLLIINGSLAFVANAFHMGEGSPDPGGLPYRFLLKGAIPLAFALLLLQGVANAIRCVQIIRGNKGAPLLSDPGR